MNSPEFTLSTTFD